MGSRNRKSTGLDGAEKTLIIRRLRCDSCEKIHHELPDFIVPYKHYDAQVIENILKGSGKPAESCSPCEDSTARRIIRWFSLLLPYFEAAIRSLIEMNRYHNELVLELSELLPLSASRLPAGWLVRLVRALVNSGRWLQTRLAVHVH